MRYRDQITRNAVLRITRHQITDECNRQLAATHHTCNAAVSSTQRSSEDRIDRTLAASSDPAEADSAKPDAQRRTYVVTPYNLVKDFGAEVKSASITIAQAASI